MRRSQDAARLIGTESFDLLITELRMPGVSGMDLLRLSRAQDPDLAVVILTRSPSVDTAVGALKAGASEYLDKPVNLDELRTVTERLLENRRVLAEHRLLQRRLDGDYGTHHIVGASPP